MSAMARNEGQDRRQWFARLGEIVREELTAAG